MFKFNRTPVHFSIFAALWLVSFVSGTSHAQTYDNIPLLFPRLEIHTDDSDDAGTDDPMFVRFGVGNSTYTYRLDNPGNDFARNGTGFYDLPTIGSAAAQMKDLKYIKIMKDAGSDGVRIDRVALWLQGTKVWEYKSSDSYSGPYLTTSGGNGDVVLDSDIGVLEARFSDVTINYNPQAPISGRLAVTIKTCNVANADSAGELRAYWKHDGMPEPSVFLGSAHGVNQVQTYGLVDSETIGTLNDFRLRLKGTDAICIDYVSITNGSQTIVYSGTDVWLDSADADTWDELDLADDKTVQTGSSTGRVGRALQRAKFATSLQTTYLTPASATTRLPICNAPSKVDVDWLAGVIKTKMASYLVKYGATWGDSGYVSLIGFDKNTIHARIRFEHEAPGLGNAVFWIDFDMNFSCSGAHEITLTSSRVKTSYDAPVLSDAIVWLVEELADIDINALLLSASQNLLLSLPVDVGATQCPQLLVRQDNSDLLVRWYVSPMLAYVNGMCRFDSSQWP